MVIKACVVAYPSSASVKVGNTVTRRAQVACCGDTRGVFALVIKRNGATCGSLFDVSLRPGNPSVSYSEQVQCTTFTMPDAIQTIDFIAYHKDEKGNWKEDDRITITLTPIVGDCAQGFLVQEKEYPYDVISGATITVLGKICTTDLTGQCTITVPKGTITVATIVKEGYKTIVSDTFTACTYPIPIKLEKIRECEVGETKCIGEDLYWCRDGIWTLQQYGAPECKDAKGKITICNINDLSCPNNGEANPNDKISVTAEMKNVGGAKGKFMFYVLDQDGNELSKAGGIGYKDVKAGETWKVTPKSLDDLDFKMPTSAIIKGQLKLARLE